MEDSKPAETHFCVRVDGAATRGMVQRMWFAIYKTRWDLGICSSHYIFFWCASKAQFPSLLVVMWWVVLDSRRVLGNINSTSFSLRAAAVGRVEWWRARAS